MITADVSCKLVELDFSGIEAVLTGYRQQHLSSTDALNYIRAARLGVHALVASRALGKPADLAWPDEKLKPYLNAIKSEDPFTYDICKRTVHGTNFGMSPHGMVEKFPQYYPNLAAAQKFLSFYYEVAPSLQAQQDELRRHAREAGFLGGPAQPARPSHWDHPYGYRHWFWDVLSYQPTDEFTARKWLADPFKKVRVVKMHGRWFITKPGNDWNRVIAFYPQSIAAGRLKEAQRRLFLPWSPDYIGDAYFGRTPLLVPIHDSLLLHVPNRCVDKVVEIAARVMQEPSSFLPIPAEWRLGPFLPIGISGKIGTNWAPYLDEKKIAKIQARAAAEGKPIPELQTNLKGMDDLDLPQWVPNAGADDPVLVPEGLGDELEWQMLQRAVA